MRCPNCGAALPGAARACPTCGFGTDDPTVPGEGTETLRQTRVTPPLPAPPSGQRFVPGSLVERRYRILGLLGKGGMGEVYRADDLKLGHPVALKFLPESLSRDAGALERFLGEVRTARRVSHPNVCRVHDVGEAGGQHFLSMEYIDGEDLASLLRRIGRLPGDKALEIARQICTGLEAAHDSGVLHRDLKPANVMIDGRGRARITDFGLAGLVGSFEGDDVAGTPAYMAPEQLRGAKIDERSDIYALGLVFYELFTGKRAFADGATLGDLLRVRESSAPTSPGQLVKDLDPLVERTILRCLEKDPAARPRSVAEVLALLPGGDALAAALAAGETPSPDMVAAGGEEGSLTPWAAGGFFLVLLIALGLLAWLAPSATVAGQARPRKSPETLAAVARALLAGGAPATAQDSPVDEVYGFDYDRSFQGFIFADPAQAMRFPPAKALYFWYRSSPEPMVPSRDLDPEDPALDRSGMTLVKLDADGRLLALTRVPPPVEEVGLAAAAGADWRNLLAASGLDPATLSPAAPSWLPPYYADERQAWIGFYPGTADEVRIEAAAWRGRPSYFEVVQPWRQPQRQPAAPMPTSTMLGFSLGFTIIAGVIVLSVLMARRNLQLDRADLQGARRLATVVAAVLLASGLALEHLPPSPAAILGHVLEIGLLDAVFFAALLFVVHLALEPYLRRHSPRRVVAWTRLFEGRFRDPLVGRDILAGTCFGTLAAVIAIGSVHLRNLGEAPVVTNSPYLDDAANVVPYLLSTLPTHVLLGLVAMLLFQLLARLARSERIAGAIVFALIFVLHLLFLGSSPMLMLNFAAICTLILVSLARFGLLTTCVHQLIFMASLHGPITIDRQVAYFGSGLVSAAVILGLGGYGAWVSLGRRPLLKTLLDD